MLFINICMLTNAFMLFSKDCWRRAQLFTVLCETFFAWSKVRFSRELNEILRPAGYESDHTIIMILLSLSVCDVAVLGNS